MEPMPEAGRPGVVRRYAPFIAIVVAIAVVATVIAVASGGGGSKKKKRSAAESAELPVTPARAKALGLKVDFGPGCDLTTGRVAVPSVYAAPCVPPFHGNNGGVTYPG